MATRPTYYTAASGGGVPTLINFSVVTPPTIGATPQNDYDSGLGTVSRISASLLAVITGLAQTIQSGVFRSFTGFANRQRFGFLHGCITTLRGVSCFCFEFNLVTTVFTLIFFFCHQGLQIDR